MAAVLPPQLYRCQHSQSFTKWEHGSFFSAGHYTMQESHWLNTSKINRHLDWRDRSDEPTPFISLFADRGKPIQSPRSNQTTTDLSLSESPNPREPPRQPRPALCLRRDRQHDRLPAQRLEHPVPRTTNRSPRVEDGGGTAIFSVRDTAGVFPISPGTIDAAEWLAVFEVPARLIIDTQQF